MPQRKFMVTLGALGAVAGCGLTADSLEANLGNGGASSAESAPSRIGNERKASQERLPRKPAASQGHVTIAASVENAEPTSPGGSPRDPLHRNVTNNLESSLSGEDDPDSQPSQWEGVSIGDARICEKSWEEAPGTADYTTLNRILASIGRTRRAKVDRHESRTLLGSDEFAAMDTCQKARLLKPCFERVLLEGDDWGAKRFREWAKGRMNPVRAHLAIAMQETRLGTFPDRCRGGVCNGIGMLQIVTAFDSQGRSLQASSREWDGITHNILTNIIYSARVIAVKIDFGASNLGQLAYYYNGNPTLQNYYARRVREVYQQLSRCEGV